MTFDPTPLKIRASCKWMRTVEHSVMSRTSRSINLITCCGCKNKVEYSDSWVTVPHELIGGKKIAAPVFLHCFACMTTKDATEAWIAAYGKDKAAAGPDPIRQKQEDELNEKYGIEIGEERGKPI